MSTHAIQTPPQSSNLFELIQQLLAYLAPWQSVEAMIDRVEGRQ